MIDLVAIGAPPSEALLASDFAALEDLEEVVLDALSTGGTAVVLTPPIPEGASIPDAFRRLVRLAGAHEGRLVVHVPTSALGACARNLPSVAPLPVELRLGGRQIRLHVGDLVAADAEAVVNASNTRLVLGGGVSGALARACGPALQAEMSRIARRAELRPGEVVLTSAPGMPRVKHILHAATASGGEDVVRTALRNVLDLCDATGIRSVAIPALGTGTGGVPVERCARVFAEVLGSGRGGPCAQVLIVLWTAPDLEAFRSAFDPRDK